MSTALEVKGLAKRLSSKDVLAIACGDLHLCHTPPVARSAEPDWYEAMERSLKQLRLLQEQLEGVPVICAGDIFDRWNPPTELVNFAIEHLPRMYAVPGQHDLPNHDYSNIMRSGYGTLVLAGTITNLCYKVPIVAPGPFVGNSVTLHGFPWDTRLEPQSIGMQSFSIAVVHKYVWTKGHNYQGAPEENNLKPLRKLLKGYDAAVFGDNHNGFIDGNVINCGTFMKRKTDEAKYRPQVGLILKNGGIKPYYLKTSGDILQTSDHIDKFLLDMTEFVAELRELGDGELNFEDAVRQLVNGGTLRKPTRQILLELLSERR